MARLTRCLALLLSTVLLVSCAAPAPTTTTLRLGDTTWTMELAIGEAAIRNGLMGRTELAADEGMLFVFPRAEPRSFWMAWCVMPIDLVFLDGRGRVVALHEMVVEPPFAEGESNLAYLDRMPSYPSGVPVRFAAEFQAGTIQRLSINRGDKFELNIQPLLEQAARTP